jgi:hypothetical protein
MTDLTDAEQTAVAAFLDKQAIRDALMRYCRGVDRLDEALLASVYHGGAWDHHGRFDMIGTEFAKHVVGFMKTAALGHQHRIANISIELDGDTAHVESYLHSLMNHADRVDEFIGRYVDRFEKRNGEWKIAERWVVVDFTRMTPVADRFGLETTFIRGQRATDDQSYARVLPDQAEIA